MLSLNKCIVILSLVLSATALSSGHVARSNHRGIARNARPDILADAVQVQKRTRSNSQRCKVKSSTSSSSSHTSTFSKKISKATTPAAKFTPAYTPPATSTTSSSKPKKTSGGGDGSDGGSSDGGSSGGGDLITGGIGTFFTQNGNEGACGDTNPDSAIICALQTSVYDNGAHCGQYVLITNTKTGKTIPVRVADECPTCDNSQSIDLSTGAFQALGGTVEEGIFPIEWRFQ